MSLTKNSKLFRKVGKDLWAMNEWYGGKAPRGNGKKKDQGDDAEAAEALKATKG